jgi:hypothetical protein
MRFVRSVRRVLFVMLATLGASPALAQVVRVSVSTADAQGNNASQEPSFSASGRFVAF